MNRLKALLATSWLTLVVSALCIACGGGGNNNGDTPDANVVVNPPDARRAECDPLAQSGCEQGQKCTWVPEGSLETGSTRCVPDGTVAPGDPCLASTTGDGDDCRAGGFCLRGRCVPVCSIEDDTCNANDNTLRCTLYGGLFADQGGTAGLCRPVCDPLIQNCGSGEACYLLDLTGKGACGLVSPTAAMRVQDDPCHGPAPGECYQESCARGFDVIPLERDNFDPTVCMQFCTPTATGIGQLEYIQGNPTGTVCGQYHPSAADDGSECRFLNILRLSDETPDALGICVTQTFAQAAGLGSCRTHDLNAAPTPANIANGTYVLGCESYFDP